MLPWRYKFRVWEPLSVQKRAQEKGSSCECGVLHSCSWSLSEMWHAHLWRVNLWSFSGFVTSRCGCGQGALREHLEKPLLFQHCHPLESKLCKIFHAFELSFRSGLIFCEMLCFIVNDEKHFSLALWYFFWIALDCTLCHWHVCVCPSTAVLNVVRKANPLLLSGGEDLCQMVRL